VISFFQFAELCRELGQTRSRLQMVALVGDFLAGLSISEAEIAARLLIGQALAQGEEQKLNLSRRAIWQVAAELSGGADQGEDIFAAASDFGEAIELVMRLRANTPEPTLTITEVGSRLAAIAAIEGRQARRRKLEALRDLLARATALEAGTIAKILVREMRHGMNEGIMLEAIARTAQKPVDEIRRLHMFEGDAGRVVAILRGGTPAATATTARLRPLKPMLAHPIGTVEEAFEIMGPRFALEHKLDGARVQIHRDGGTVRIFSRRLNEISLSLPDITSALERAPGQRFIADGEVIAVDTSGRPRAFEELMRRFRRIRNVDRMVQEQPVRLFVFDLVSLNGELLIDRPYKERFALLTELAERAGLSMAKREIVESPAEARKFYDEAVAAGYEGVMAKALDSAYTPGVRGRGWLKIKHSRTLDLVIVAADWGYGRRRGWLSNYHLAARNESGNGFSEVGKTFKGPSDDEFRELTERLLKLKTGETRGTVDVRPELVVEVAFSNIQRSRQYSTGMALRFARILRIRNDKLAAEADTIAAVAREYERQIVRPL
jgi:DNA ligase-1